MGTVQIPGLMYNGKQCSYDDGQTTTPPVEPPVEPPVTGAPAPGAGPNAVKYTTVENASEDNYWMNKKLGDYRDDLSELQGSQQLYYDILVNAYGKRYSDAVPSKPGYAKDDKMKLHISNLINYASYNGQGYDPATYTGRLIPIYDQLVVDKKAGLIGPPV